MRLADFENLLQRTMGLDASSIGSSVVERAVLERVKACNLRDPDTYWERLCASQAELQELVEAVVVPETWFFRDTEAFAAMARIVSKEWLPNHPGGVLRLLSLPCATGEEPYSMAMTLLEAGVPADNFRVDAVDISLRALERAEQALFGKNSFRGENADFRSRHFERVGDRYRLSDAVRRQVRFEQGNLFDAGFLPGSAIYDIIFCRNVLIYFDRSTQDRAIQVLTRLLTPTGVLFVGPSETGLLLSHDFVSAKVPLAFAFRKPIVSPGPIRNSARRIPPTPAPRATIPPPFQPVRTPSPPRNRVSQPVPPAVQGPSIEDVRRLADQGRLAEAAQCCEDHLRIKGPSSEAFYLLGLVHDATGVRNEAADLYRKALYLDPNHHEALVHLALLLEKKGDVSGAKVLSDRARRIEQRVQS